MLNFTKQVCRVDNMALGQRADSSLTLSFQKTQKFLWNIYLWAYQFHSPRSPLKGSSLYIRWGDFCCVISGDVVYRFQLILLWMQWWLPWQSMPMGVGRTYIKWLHLLWIHWPLLHCQILLWNISPRTRCWTKMGIPLSLNEWRLSQICLFSWSTCFWNISCLSRYVAFLLKTT